MRRYNWAVPSMMRRRSARRACALHGGDSYELAGESGSVERHLERRQWLAEAEHERLAVEEERAALRQSLVLYVDRAGVERRLTLGVIGYQWEQPTPEVMERIRARREARGW